MAGDVLREFEAALRHSHPECLPGVSEEQDDERIRDSRRAWTPTIGHLFGIRPWEMGLLTLREIRVMGEYVEALNG